MALIATFYSHYGAMSFRRLCRERGVACELMPVPRTISSSCGTCARFDRSPLYEGEEWSEDIELVVEEEGPEGPPYRELHRSEDY